MSEAAIDGPIYSVACVHCGTQTVFYELPERPPSPFFAVVACNSCGQDTVVGDAVYEPATGDGGEIGEEE